MFIPDKPTFVPDKQTTFIPDKTTFIPDEKAPKSFITKVGEQYKKQMLFTAAFEPLLNIDKESLFIEQFKELQLFGPVTRPIIPAEKVRKLPILQPKPYGERYGPAFIRAAARDIVPRTVEILTTPGTYLIGPLAKTGAGLLAASRARPFIQKYLPTFFRGALERTAPEFLRYQRWLQSPQISPTATELIQRQLPPAVNPVTKIIQALKEAKPVRATQELLYSIERAKRAGAVAAIGERVPGEKGFFAQLRALKGELPKVQFEGIRGKVSQGDIDSLFNMIEQSGTLLPLEKIATKTGLAKLLGEAGGVVPTKGELKLLNQVFSKEFITTVLTKRPFLQKIGQGIAEVLNVPRAIMASTDMSAPLRQGVFLIGRPKRFWTAFGHMFKYFFREKAYQDLMKNIKARPNYPLMKQSKLSLTEIGGMITQREEAFMSQLAEKIPLMGPIIRASNRAYTGFLNKLRADVFDDLVSSASKLGLPVRGKLLNDISRFVGAATGRGTLKTLEGVAVALNTVLFSPRLMASRLNLLNPVFYIRLDPFVRRQALKALFTFAGIGSTTLTLAKLGGAEVGIDPRSADFGKIKVGNTRYDPWGGFQQYIRAAVQLVSGEIISSTTGVKMTLGEGYKPMTRLDILIRFFEMKEAPVMSFATNLLRGRTFGKPTFDVKLEVANRFIPMVIQDMADIYLERGISGIPMALPAVFGLGMQTYAPTASGVVRAMNTVTIQAGELMKQGRLDEARKLITQNVHYLETGKQLEPLYTMINKLRKIKLYMSKNIILPKEQRKEGVNRINALIKSYEMQMERMYKGIKKGTFIPDFMREGLKR